MENPLKEHFEHFKDQSLRDLINKDPERTHLFSINVDGLQFDYSKNYIDTKTLQSLCRFAHENKMQDAIDSLFLGDKINNTEQRAAHHTALRQPPSDTPTSHQVQKVLATMETFIESITQQQWRGYTNKNINTIINIGIGGSDLGPRMVAQALTPYHLPQLNIHFVANIDGAELEDVLLKANPETTLFIVASKSFSTLETLSNALSARQWLLDNHCEPSDLSKHFVAISSNIEAANQFGIAKENIFPIWDWVGGRYSLWSAIGLPIALSIGMKNFRHLLAGAHTMDKHFQQAPLNKNMPVIAALLSYWYSHYWGSTSYAVLPYAQRLSRFPAYLQQLDMESLGKRVNKEGRPISYPTGSVIWGTEGTNGQHSFHQLLHQGMQLIPVDFIAVKQPMSRYTDHHQHLLACCISQSQALLQGKSLAQAKEELHKQGLSDEAVKHLAPHKVIPGNKPSNVLIMDELSPQNLGGLIAFYEHKVYALSVLLDINAFDQWGVELGKQLGKPVHRALVTGEYDSNWDSSTLELIKTLRDTTASNTTV